MSLYQSVINDIAHGKAADREKVRRMQDNPFKFFHLADAVGVRPPVLQYVLPLDDAFLTDLARDISESREAGKRVGTEWLPASARSVQTKETSDDHWASHDDLKPLNDVCTKWCTFKYFPDAFSRVNMVANVIRLYDRLRDITGLKFNIIFKGGVMIRLILLEFLSGLPLERKVKVVEYLNSQRALSMSDFDFEIVLDDHDAPDDHVHRFCLMSYAALLWLQRCMQREIENAAYGNRKTGGLLNLAWDVEESTQDLRRRLQQEVDALDASSQLHGCTIDHVVVGDTDPSPPRGYRTRGGGPTPASRKNMAIFPCDGTKCVMTASTLFGELGQKGVPATSGGGSFYATLNTYIGEEAEEAKEERRSDAWPSLFHLSRIKHAFIVYYTTRDGHKRCDRLGGEMIDLSLSHSVTKNVMRRHLYRSVARPYREYPLLGVDHGDVTLRSYSVEGFLFDHMIMTHHTDEEPWKMSKMEKRLARYVAFLFAHVFSPDVHGSHERKLKAMRMLADGLAPPTLLASSPPLRTGVATIDSFAARQRESLLSAQPNERAAYCANLVRCLEALLSGLSSASQKKIILNRQHLETASHLVYR